jgi:phage replication O-like protein O
MYTRLPNWIIEQLPTVSAPAVKIILLVARKTIGWNRARDAISLSQFESGTGITRPTIVKAIEELERAKILVVYKSNRSSASNEYQLVSAESLIESDDDGVKEFNQGSKKDLPVVVKEFNQEVVKEFNTQKKDIKKRKKSSTIRDPRIDAWQLQVYRELARYHVPIAFRDEILNTVTDETIWANVIRTWIGRGYRPNAVGSMLEWYRKGIPNGTPRPQRTQRPQRQDASRGRHILTPEEYIQQQQQRGTDSNQV